MATYKNIEEYRSKKKRKNFLKKSLVFIVIIAILIVLLNVLQIFKGTSIGDFIDKDNNALAETYPLTIKSKELLNVYNIGSNTAILSKTDLSIHSDNGNVLQKIIHGYTNPVVKEGVKKLLTYDRGGNKLRVDTSNERIGEIKTTDQIIFAQISVNGSVAVLTKHDRYACKITVYNSVLEESYNYLSTELLCQVAFSVDNKHIMATQIVTNNGILSTNLYELDMGSDSPATKFTINDIVPIDISYNSVDDITIIGKESLVSFNMKLNKEYKYEYDGALQYVSNSEKNVTTLVTTDILNEYSKVTIIGKNSEVKYTKNIEDVILDLYTDGSRVIFLSKKYAYNYDMTLTQLNKIELKKTYKKVICNGESLYVLGADIIEKFKIN